MSTFEGFPRLLEPGRIGQMSIRNRMVMPPMGTGLASSDGHVSERLIAYYGERAKGGVGLLIVEGSCVDFPSGIGMLNQPRLDDGRFVLGLAHLADAIHEHGAIAAIQLFHGGRVAKARLAGGVAVAPSAIGVPGGEVPHELTHAEIDEIVTRFADAARRVADAGFDGVEIHGAHAYLIANFLSSSTNKRTDDYGGDLSGRARFLLEIVQAVRETVGHNTAVWVRLNGQEIGLPGGINVDEAMAVAAMAEAAGADAVHVSAFGYGHPVMWASTPQEPGFLRQTAATVKHALSVPVIAVGRITPAIGEQMLREKQADFIAFGRALIADPDLPRQVADGSIDEIRPCIGCVKCRDRLISTGQPIVCAVNPAVGREREWQPRRAAQVKKIVVVGGGPAGMEAARMAALRGYEVTLFEKASVLGGQLVPGAKPPEKADLVALNRYLGAQLAKLGVTVELGKPAMAALVAERRPDAVVVASGTAPMIPALKGVAENKVITALDVLAGSAVVGDRVAVIGGELVGCEVAEFLATEGKQVTVLRRGAALATKINPSPRLALLRRLAEKGVRTLTGVQYEEITAEGVVITNADGGREVIAADTVVLATGGLPERSIVGELEQLVPVVYSVGDCSEPQSILEAISDGQRVGLLL